MPIISFTTIWGTQQFWLLLSTSENWIIIICYYYILWPSPLLKCNIQTSNHTALHFNKVLQQPTLKTDKDNREKTCTAGQIQSSGSMFMEFVNCTDQIHKVGEDFTLSLGNMTLIIPQDWDRMKGEARRGRRGQWQRWRQRGENKTYRWQSLWPSGGLPEQGLMNKRARETVTERHRYQLYLCNLILSWSAWWLLQVS